jgi:hypothetical protein
MTIILADAEIAYLQVLKKRLTELIPGIELILCDHIASIQEFVCPPDSNWLCIFNVADFGDLPRLLGRLNDEAYEFWPVLPGIFAMNNSLELTGETQALWRIGSVILLADRLLTWQKKHSAKKLDLLVNVNASPNDVQAAPAGLHFLFSAAESGYRPDLSRKRLMQLIAEGRPVIYLPLMPTYQMCCLASPGHGPSLSDLLLHLLGKNIQVEQLGHYLQPHPDGYLQFRPPDRSDDLVTCPADILRQLVVLLRDYIGKQPGETSALIDCAGLPMAAISSISVLCDSCEILMPERDGYAAVAARREISQLLADLPLGCKIVGNINASREKSGLGQKAEVRHDA